MVVLFAVLLLLRLCIVRFGSVVSLGSRFSGAAVPWPVPVSLPSVAPPTSVLLVTAFFLVPIGFGSRGGPWDVTTAGFRES
eukprot:2232554-Pyramimonas_sp.AAC.1